MLDRAFSRADESDDARFYEQPRFVEHIDDGAIAAVVDLHREFLPPGGAILDCMSSWVSHLPPEVAYGRVAGLGMNAAELRANPRLDAFVVHDLNRDPHLPFGDAEFDGAVICVSVQYLRDPIAVLRDLGRVMRPDAPLVISFSNRCFPTKAVAVWRALDDAQHAGLVASYCEASEVWGDVERLDRSFDARGRRRRGDPLFAVVARRVSA